MPNLVSVPFHGRKGLKMFSLQKRYIVLNEILKKRKQIEEPTLFLSLSGKSALTV